jgi:rhodanese-related sulfurtransferase
MRLRIQTWLVLWVLLTVLVVPAAGRAASDDQQYINPDALKGMLGAPDLLIIDVRQPHDWINSDQKIQGAVRQEPADVATWGPNLPKNKKIVLYCA